MQIWANAYLDVLPTGRRYPGVNLGKYLFTSRVKIIDDDVFPSNRFREALSELRISDIAMPQLLFEYIRQNFKHPTVRWGSLQMMATDLVFVFLQPGNVTYPTNDTR